LDTIFIQNKGLLIFLIKSHLASNLTANLAANLETNLATNLATNLTEIIKYYSCIFLFDIFNFKIRYIPISKRKIAVIKDEEKLFVFEYSI